ncbi:MAG: hypothetical protein CL587_18215 [Alteromonadaceae bacterium]|nr:hypothetical protein [Alteromonadaceae bacterium]
MNFPVHDFHFLRPEWFAALLPLCLLILLIRQYRRSQSGWQSVIPSHLYKHLIAGKAVAGKQAPLSLLALCWFICVVALAGPVWERLPQPVFQVQEGHVVVIDMSLSMRATDVSPDRLTRAKYKAIDLINSIDEGETGLVAYAGDAFTISPLTADAGNLVALLPGLSPEIMPVAGSDPYRGIQEAADLLQNAGYQQGNIYWLTDGITLPQAQDLRSLISELPYTVNILGVGTEEGAPIRQLDGQLLKDQRGQIVIPKLRGQQLQNLAGASGGVYSKLSAGDSDIKRLTGRNLLHNNAEETGEQTSQDGDQWAELGPWLLLLILPFAAYAFRRGVVLTVLLIPLLAATPQPVFAQTGVPVKDGKPEAETPVTPWYETPFLNADQQGAKEYDAGNFDTAADIFKSAEWQGAAAYESGNYEQALDAFSRSDSTDAVYNQGNALAQLGKLDDAIARYDEVLKRDPEHADAKANKALLEQMKQKQEKQQQEQQNQQNQQQNQDQQDQNGDNQQPQDGQQGQNDENTGSDEQQQKDQSQSSGDQQQQGGEGEDQQSENRNEESQSPGQEQQNEQADGQEEENEDSESQSPAKAEEGDQQQQQNQSAQAQTGELTDEEKEKMQRLDNLMKKIPDDPAFLLKRKMQLEAQQRRRQGPPSNRSEW